MRRAILMALAIAALSPAIAPANRAVASERAAVTQNGPGVRMADFLDAYPPALIDGQPPQGGSEVGLIVQSGPKTRDVFEFSNLKVTN